MLRDLGFTLFGEMLIVLLVLVFVTVAGGCAPPFGPWNDTSTWNGNQGGATGPVIDLPFASGHAALCTQGAGGTFSHTLAYTSEDLDFDTPNDKVELLYAPVGGYAYTHEESATRNFGYHVNIDLGDGTYVVVAHLSDPFVPTGLEVAAGQILGFEGCTGACTGDHVHVGLHEGDAAQPAENGTSVPVSYFVDDVTSGESGVTLAGDAFTCGTPGGSTYASRLPVTHWHPNGSLVAVPGDAATYVLADGVLRWIENETTFWSMGYDFDDVAYISPEEKSCYAEGEMIDAETKLQAVTDGDGGIWMAVGTEADPLRYRIMVKENGWEGVLASWGFGYTMAVPPATGPAADAVLDLYPQHAGHAKFRDGSLVKEASASDVYAVTDGVAMPIETWDTLLRLGWGERPIVTVPDGVVADVQETVGSCASDFWCLDLSPTERCTLENGAPFDTSEVATYKDANDDPSSMLEEEIEDGEFALVYLPPAGVEGESAKLVATVTDADGAVLFEDKLVAVNYAGGHLVYTTKSLPSDGVFTFTAAYVEKMIPQDACGVIEGGAPFVNGVIYAQYGSEVLTLETEEVDGVCLLQYRWESATVSVPDDDSETEETDDGDSDSDPPDDSEDPLTTICYSAGVTMASGELYVDGANFSYWDQNPADSASWEDEMCATVETISGELITLNAWFDAGDGVTQWAAYNNWCQSIDWQGTVTVDGAVVSVTADPWSDAAWIADPCNTGGDGHFNVP